ATNNIPTPSPLTSIFSWAGANERFGISVEPSTLTLIPGQAASIRVRLTNTGQLVDWLTLSVEDVPAEWITLPEGEVQLNPGMQGEAEIPVLVPRQPKSRAQEPKPLLRATSRQDPDESALARMRWNVQPFTEDSLVLRPKRARGRGQARYQLLLSNEGNIPAQYALQGEDDEGRVTYQFEPDHLELEPGTEQQVPLQVRLKKHWVGLPQRYSFHVHAHSAGSRSKTVSSTGEFINKPIIPTWLLPIVGIILIGAPLVASLMGIWPSPSRAIMFPGVT